MRFWTIIASTTYCIPDYGEESQTHKYVPLGQCTIMMGEGDYESPGAEAETAAHLIKMLISLQCANYHSPKSARRY